MKKIIFLLSTLAAAATATAQIVVFDSFDSVTFDTTSGVGGAFQTGTEANLSDGDITNSVSPNNSVLINPTGTATTGLGHEFTLTLAAPTTINTIELYSDFRQLDAYVTLADIELFDAAGISLGVFNNLVFDAPSLGDPDVPSRPSDINPNDFTTHALGVDDVASVLFTIQEVNDLTRSRGSIVDATSGYQLRELRFNTVIIPEPSTTVLLGLGGLALLARRRR